MPECIRALYNKHKGKTRPSLDELFKALQIVARLFSRALVVIDALEECHLSDGNRFKFLTELFALPSASRANIFATSKFVQNITDRFKHGVSLEIRAHSEDVRRYLEGNVAYMPSCIARSMDLRGEIITKMLREGGTEDGHQPLPLSHQSPPSARTVVFAGQDGGADETKRSRCTLYRVDLHALLNQASVGGIAGSGGDSIAVVGHVLATTAEMPHCRIHNDHLVLEAPINNRSGFLQAPSKIQYWVIWVR